MQNRKKKKVCLSGYGPSFDPMCKTARKGEVRKDKEKNQEGNKTAEGRSLNETQQIEGLILGNRTGNRQRRNQLSSLPRKTKHQPHKP